MKAMNEVHVRPVLAGTRNEFSCYLGVEPQ